jgi:hypothetical protein
VKDSESDTVARTTGGGAEIVRAVVESGRGVTAASGERLASAVSHN